MECNWLDPREYADIAELVTRIVDKYGQKVELQSVWDILSTNSLRSTDGLNKTAIPW